jgi:hypothetical protein
MSNDTTLQSVFNYAKQGPLSGGEFPTLPAVFVTFVEHFPNSHPPGSQESADLVTYANGLMTLSQNKKILSGEFKVWRNAFDSGSLGFFGSPPTPPDAFADADSTVTVAITVSDSGQVTHQRKIKGKPIGGMPPVPLNAAYENGLFVEKFKSGVRSLSFTLGTTVG